MKFDVMNRWSGAVQFSAKIECAEDMPPRLKIGLAIRWAYKSGADLRGADLSGADLSGAYLSDEYKVDGAIGIIEAGAPNHWAAFGFVDQGSRALRVHVGCQRREINDGRAYWSSETHPHRADRREVLAALDYIEAVAKLRGWAAP